MLINVLRRAIGSAICLGHKLRGTKSARGLLHFGDTGRNTEPDVNVRTDLNNCTSSIESLPKFQSDSEALASHENIANAGAHDFWAVISAAGVKHQMGQFNEALILYRKALDLDARYAGSIYVNMGVVLKDLARISEAKSVLTKAVTIAPKSPEAHYNLGLVFYESGELADAMQQFEAAITLQPDFQAAHSSLLCIYGLTRNFAPLELFEKHREWAKRYADPITANCFTDYPLPLDGARITVGYVSADFREHSMQYFLEPIFSNHDRKSFRIICYDNWRGEDVVNRRLRSYADAWRKIHDLSDDVVAKRIRDDRVDILVDLSGHTAGNRLLVFARRPAPVQVTWLGYMCTTGLAAMDYRITDAYLDPPGKTDAYYTEKLVRISAAAAYSPAVDAPPVSPLPALRSGYLTFGSMNNYTKLSEDVIDYWVQILCSVNNSRLLLVVLGGDEPEVQNAILRRFARAWPNSPKDFEDQIIIKGRRPFSQFLHYFHEIDIALDPFPYSGGTTSLHTLWMGVPIITMEGNSELSRSTSGMIHACGLSRLVAKTGHEYRKIARDLAADLNQLTEIREALRGRLASSVLANARETTASLEAAYHEMWMTNQESASKSPRHQPSVNSGTSN